MNTYDAVAEGVDKIALHYPGFAPKDDAGKIALCTDYHDSLCWCAPDAIAAGFRLALTQGGKFAPKFGEIVAAVKEAEKRRNGTISPIQKLQPDAYCALCGTKELVEEPDPFADHADPRQRRNIPRMWPRHMPGCQLERPRLPVARRLEIVA